MKNRLVLSILIKSVAFYLLICLPYDCTNVLWALVDFAMRSVAIDRPVEVIPLACIVAVFFWIVFCVVFYVVLIVKSDFIVNKLYFGKTAPPEVSFGGLSFDQIRKICLLCAGLFLLARSLPDCAGYIMELLFAVAERIGGAGRSEESVLSYMFSRSAVLIVQLFCGLVLTFRPSKVLKYFEP